MNEYRQASDPDYQFDQQVIASLVGAVALLLPGFLLFFGWKTGMLRQSISHYYYLPLAGDVFVGALCFIGAMLIAFRGRNGREFVISTMAGAAAIVVALFPTIGPGFGPGTQSARLFAEAEVAVDTPGVARLTAGQPQDGLFQLFSGVRYLHYVSAAVLFLALGFLCLWVFTLVSPGQEQAPGGSVTPVKRWRNAIYRGCGGVIFGVIAILTASHLAGLDSLRAWDSNNLTFWLESLMVWGFGLAWIVKGRIFGRALTD